ncbi:MAG: diguanylate cyclase [Synergistaceae bacterium]|nr:diguanylate cyclase [Synergistaceae bacterium]
MDSNAKKALIIDDDETSRTILSLALGKFDVIEAANGAEGLELLKKHQEDIAFIILDIVMPVMDGFAFLEEMRAFPLRSPIPVIVLTEHADTRNKHRALSLGVADFIYKPIQPEEVMLRVENVLSRYGGGFAYNDHLQREFLDLVNGGIPGGVYSVYIEDKAPLAYVSRAMALRLGYESQIELYEACGGTTWELVPEEEREAYYGSIREQLREKGEFVAESSLIKKDGSRIWTRCSGQLTKDDGGRPLVVALCLDITDLKKTQEALRASERRANYLQSLADIALANANISVWEYDFLDRRVIQRQDSSRKHGFGTIIPDVPDSLVKSGYVHPDSAEAFLEMYRRLAAGSRFEEGVFKVQTADRSGYFYEHIRYTNIYGDDGKPYRAVGTSSDVTEQYNMAQRYRRELQYKQLVTPDAFSTALINLTRREIEEIHSDIEADDRILKMASCDNVFSAYASVVAHNPEAAEYFRRLSPEFLLDAFQEGENVLCYEFLYRWPKRGHTWISFDIHLTVDPETRDVMAFVYVRDIDRRKRELEALSDMAQRDSLSGLLNHKATFAAIGDFLDGAGRKGIHALLLIDLDNFKKLNDTLGHQAGDRELMESSARLSSTFRHSDIVGRIGGDEFMVFMKNIGTPELARDRARRICERERRVCEEEGRSVQLSCSVGMSICRDGDKSLDEMYREADAALYRAKAKGKGRCSE